jgi:hypothetical protein
MDSNFLADAGFLCGDASVIAVVLRDMIEKYLLHLLYQHASA